MNIKEFYADNLGEEYCKILSAALSPQTMRTAITQTQ
jgi:hypothetical protein